MGVTPKAVISRCSVTNTRVAVSSIRRYEGGARVAVEVEQVRKTTALLSKCCSYIRHQSTTTILSECNVPAYSASANLISSFFLGATREEEEEE